MSRINIKIKQHKSLQWNLLMTIYTIDFWRQNKFNEEKNTLNDKAFVLKM